MGGCCSQSSVSSPIDLFHIPSTKSCLVIASPNSLPHDHEKSINIRWELELNLLHPDKEIECPFCMEIVKKQQAMILNCSHILCINCARKWIESEMSEKTEFFVKCPFSCGSSFSYKEMEAILDPEKFALFQRRVLELSVALDPSLHFCRTPNCIYIVSWESEAENGIPRLDCPICKKTSCILCGLEPYHKGMTCEEAVEYWNTQEQINHQNEVRSLAYLREMDMKHCRRCRAGVLKDSGCDKMMCRCGYKFCFRCGAENAVCRCTPSYHLFWNNVAGRGEF